MGSMGPMLGQAHHFRKYAPEQLPWEKIPEWREQPGLGQLHIFDIDEFGIRHLPSGLLQRR